MCSGVLTAPNRHARLANRSGRACSPFGTDRRPTAPPRARTAVASGEGAGGRDERRGRREAVGRPGNAFARKVLTWYRPWLWLLPVVLLLLCIGIYPLIYNVRNSF